MAELLKLQYFMAEKKRRDGKNKIAYTFRCSPEVWEELRAIQTHYDLKMNDTLEAIIEYAYQNL